MVPVESPADLAAYIQDLEDRLAVLESPGSPTLVYACTKANLPSAVIFINRIAYAIDLVMIVYSDGTNWRRADTGAIA